MSNDELQKAIDDITSGGASDSTSVTSDGGVTTVSDDSATQQTEQVDEGTQELENMVNPAVTAAPDFGFPTMPPAQVDESVTEESAAEAIKAAAEAVINNSPQVLVSNAGGSVPRTEEMAPAPEIPAEKTEEVVPAPVAPVVEEAAPEVDNMISPAVSAMSEDVLEATETPEVIETTEVLAPAPEVTEEPAPAPAVEETTVEAEPATETVKEEKVVETTIEKPKDAELEEVKINALKELYPLLEKMNVNSRQKFDICMKVVEETGEKGATESALSAAKGIADEEERGECLMKLVDIIDEME